MKAFKENGGSLAGTPQQQLLDEIEGHSVEIGRMRVALISFFRLLRDSEVLMDNHRWGLHRYPPPLNGTMLWQYINTVSCPTKQVGLE